MYIKQTPWLDKVSDAVVLEKALKAFLEITAEDTYTKKRVCYRIAGQSGTGKTTQLLPTVLECEKRLGNNPVVVAVRRFAAYHPNHSLLKDDKNWREKTNGFALKCLTAVLKLLVEDGYMIVFDMTLLHPDYEDYIFSLLQKNGYTTNYQIMAVNPLISGKLIQKRAFESGAEGGRIVKKETADYFNEILPLGLAYLCDADKRGVCFVWTAFDKDPLYIGTLEYALEPFEKGRAIIKELAIHEDELRQAKLEKLLDCFPCQFFT